MKYLMLILLGVILFCGFGSNPVQADKVSDIVKPEYRITVFDLSNLPILDAYMFHAFSNESENWQKVSFEYLEADEQSVISSQISDYFFFEARYINRIENLFWNNQEHKLRAGQFEERLEAFRVFLFQQPLWLIHLANRLPTALIEWNFFLEQRFTSQNRWPMVYGSLDLNFMDHDQLHSLVVLSESNNLLFSFYIPPKDIKLTTHGLMLHQRVIVNDHNQAGDVVEKLLRQKLKPAEDSSYDDIPLNRIYIVNDTDKTQFYIGTSGDKDFDLSMLINRVGAKEKGWFTSSEGIFDDAISIQRYASWQIPAENEIFFKMLSAETSNNFFKKPFSFPSSRGLMMSITGLMLKGLLSWIVVFTVFHIVLLKRIGIGKLISLSILCFVVYAVVSTLFSFIYGFGFILGILAMESIVKRNAGGYPVIKLFGLGMMTAISISLIAMLF